VLRKLKPREAPLEKRAVTEITKRGGKVLKIIAVGVRGFPDRMILMPGLVVFIEFKKPTGGVVSPHQEKWARLLAYFGFHFYFVHTDQELNKVLQAIDVHMARLLMYQRQKEKQNEPHGDELR